MSITSTLESEKRSPRAQAGHLAYLDGVRGLAALTVFLGHAIGFRANGVFASVPWVFNSLHHAVALFIVLSGFCLMLPVSRNGGELRGGVKRFFARRARRILPPYYITVALSLILIRLALNLKMDTVWDYAVPVTPGGLLAHLLLLHDFSHPHEINGVLWSIAIEWQIYFLFPALIVAVRRYGWAVVAPVMVASSWLLMVAGHHNVRWVAVNPQFLGLFVLGMLGADIAYAPGWAALRERVRWRRLAAVLGALLVPLYAVFFGAIQRGGGRSPLYVELLDPLFGLFAIAALIAVGVARAPTLKRCMEWPPLVRIGTFSYSLYLIHLPLEALLWKYVVRVLPYPNGIQCLILTVISALTVVPISYGFYLLCEKPFMVKR